MEKENIKTRESNIELLRIISMVMIFIYHYCIHGSIFKVGSYTINKLVGYFLAMGGRVGVNLFILIMGYFMVKSRFKIKKLLKLMLQVFLYSVLLAILAVYRYQSDFDTMDIHYYFKPILYNGYWFVTAYAATYIFSPFLSRLVKTLKKKNCQKLIIVGGLVLSILPTVFDISFIYTDLIWFVYMYIIGAYIGEYNIEFKSKKTPVIVSILYPIITYGTIIISIAINKYFNKNLDVIHFTSLYSTLGLIASICIFDIFKNIHIKSNKIINYIAKISFATYLISDHTLYKRIFWTLDFKTQVFDQVPVYMFIGHVLFCTIGIYIIAAILETIRVYLIEKPLFKIKILDKYFDKIDNWMNIN